MANAKESVLLYAKADGAGVAAYQNRIYDMLIRIKEDLGVDELLLAIDDSSRIASDKVAQYLTNYKTQVAEVIKNADDVASAAFDKAKGDLKAFGDAPAAKNTIRSGKNIEKLVTLNWKNSYEIGMEDLNSRMPLAQQIVSKYMSNFNVKPKV